MSDDYTPTTEDIAEQFIAGAMVTGFVYSRKEGREVWDEYLAAHDREVAEAAWDEGMKAGRAGATLIDNPHSAKGASE